jgi:hypothetical protein
VKLRKSHPMTGIYLERGTKLVIMTRNIISVRRIVDKKDTLSPEPMGMIT